MTTIEWLDKWKREGIISDAQCSTLSALVRNERFSVFFELNALLYLGVVSLVGGLGWTFSRHFEKLGDVFILTILSGLLALSLYYCFSKASSYSNAEVESPNFVFDYVLYLACLVLSVELGYIEVRFEWLRDAWDNYLLFCSIVFFIFAYRFDNRFVLSLALSSLAGWFGVKVSRFGFVSSEPLRLSALVYAFVIALVGTFMYRQGIKKHFLETYLHIAAIVSFASLISGLSGETETLFLLGLLGLSAACMVLGIRFKRFAFVVYAVVAGYIGISKEVLHPTFDLTPMLIYFIVTGSGVIALLVFLARRFGREE